MKKVFMLLFMFSILGVELFASSTGLPWEGPLTLVVNSVTGPVAFGISVIAVVSAGAMLIFGGEIAGFLKGIIILALVISLIVLAVNVLSTVFGTSSALII